MRGFTLLWSKILDSSIWMEDKETRLVWITLLAMKDKDGIVQASRKNLAHRARVEPDECERALNVLSSPDKEKLPPQENEGRRIKEVAGGWIILNHDKYRFSTEAPRVFWAEDKAQQRQRSKALSGVGAGEMPPTPRSRTRKLPVQKGYVAHSRSEESGASQNQTDAIMEDTVPKKEVSEPLAQTDIPDPAPLTLPPVDPPSEGT